MFCLFRVQFLPLSQWILVKKNTFVCSVGLYAKPEDHFMFMKFDKVEI